MISDNISILDGNKFVVSNREGDMEATPTDNHGLFLNDTRFLSRWVLTVDGRRPKLLSVDDTAYFAAQHFLALATGTVYVDSHLTLIRRRFVNGGFREDLVVINHDHVPIDLKVEIEAGADFADLFEVKDKLNKKGELYRRAEAGALTLGYRRGQYCRETRITSSVPAEIDDRGLSFQVHLEPKAEWTTSLMVRALADPGREDLDDRSGLKETSLLETDDETARAMSGDLRGWLKDAPRLSCSWEPLEHTYRRSLIDLAALRFRSGIFPGALPAAGLPWFMTVFGRDSLLTSFQALPFAPELAATTLDTLALLQARRDDPFRDAEPGKIPHELRFGEMTAFQETPHSPYYGTADATPLFLILLEEYERWTSDRKLVRKLERAARAAANWIDQYGDRDGDGYIEYETRSPRGLGNQCWKDSGDSITYADGTLASLPRATCELQGYAYDAKRRTARLARDVWDDPKWSEDLEHQAAQLKRRFNQDFWMPKRHAFALALDGEKRQVDSLTSNIGHLLWSGIADREHAEHCARHLTGDALFSGWGVRTMAVGEGSYNPIGYHVGTVWPHDNSIIAWGLRRYGFREEAAKIAMAMLEAAEFFHSRLPEAFAGYSRASTKYPVEYPTACSPQAWATGAPLLLMRALLGLESDGEHLLVDPALPDSIRQITLLDFPGPWGRMDAFGRARATALRDSEPIS
ncbi:MAG TPA: glycogen debranching N-terminal domain-containing protein [Phenylobacterium sp.]